MLGIFESLFDFNGNGKMDFFEESMKWASIGMAIDHINKAEDADNNTGSIYGNISTDDSSNGCLEYESYIGGAGNTSETNDTPAVYSSYLRDDLEMAGIDVDEFECLDETERRDALEKAGLDPWDYDIY